MVIISFDEQVMLPLDEQFSRLCWLISDAQLHLMISTTSHLQFLQQQSALGSIIEHHYIALYLTFYEV